MGEKESCNSRHFSRLMKSCFPNPNDNPSIIIPQKHHKSSSTATLVVVNTISTHLTYTSSKTTITSLPDDVLLEILSRSPLSSLPSLSSVCRHWHHLLLNSPSFSLLRRHHRLLHPTLFAFSLSSPSPLISSLRPFEDHSWKTLPQNDVVLSHIDLTHARLVPIGRKIFIIGRSICAIFDPWTGLIKTRSGLLFPRKRFAAAEVSGRVYVTGGSSRVTSVEEYDPDKDEWRVVADAPRRRYGCIGVGVEGVFYVIGGLKIGGACESRAAVGSEARVYASSMDCYDVAARGWLRSRAVPGGGCVVAACGAEGYVYVLASHAVELSFWRFNGRRKGGSGSSNNGSGNSNFWSGSGNINFGSGNSYYVGGSGNGNNGSGSSNYGEWCRMRSPPLPAQVRLDGTVRFSCVGVQDKVVLIQVMGCIDDLLRRSGRNIRGCKDGLVLIFDCVTEEWSRGPDLPEVLQRSVSVCVEC